MANLICESKVCNRCKEDKSLSDYSRVHSQGNVYRTYCKKCAVKMVQEAKKGDKLHWRRTHLKRNFDMTMEDFDKMLDAQDYKCLICANEFDMETVGKRPNLDHCHTTNKVRGILCFNCNTGIGKLNDDPNLLMAAFIYLKKYE